MKPFGFAEQTGSIRGILSGVRALALNPQQVAHLVDQIEQGLRSEVADSLVAQGARPTVVNELIADLSALPATYIIPQSTAVTEHNEDNDEA